MDIYGIETLKQKLKQGLVTIKFIKIDGTIRTMICTLEPGIISSLYTSEKKTDRSRAPNDDVLAVFDWENKGWRSFRVDSIIDVCDTVTTQE